MNDLCVAIIIVMMKRRIKIGLVFVIKMREKNFVWGFSFFEKLLDTKFCLYFFRLFLEFMMNQGKNKICLLFDFSDMKVCCKKAISRGLFE
jgi:hypothetical protein